MLLPEPAKGRTVTSGGQESQHLVLARAEPLPGPVAPPASVVPSGKLVRGGSPRDRRPFTHVTTVCGALPWPQAQVLVG